VGGARRMGGLGLRVGEGGLGGGEGGVGEVSFSGGNEAVETGVLRQV